MATQAFPQSSLAITDALRDLIDMRRAGELAHVSGERVRRWIVYGVYGVRLRGTRLGRAWRTTPAWLMAFGEALAARNRAEKP